MQQQITTKVWEYLNQMWKAERRRGGNLSSKVDYISRMDPSITPDDLISEFVVVLLDKNASSEKDYVELRAEMLWDTSDYFLRRKLSFAFRTFISAKVKFLKRRKTISANIETDAIEVMSNKQPTQEDIMFENQMTRMLTHNEEIVLAWRLREISTEEALQKTGYKGKPSLYKVLDDIRAKVYGRPVISKNNSKQRKADK